MHKQIYKCRTNIEPLKSWGLCGSTCSGRNESATLHAIYFNENTTEAYKHKEHYIY